MDIQNYETTQATLCLMKELAKGRKSGGEDGWLTPEEVWRISKKEPRKNKLHYTPEFRRNLNSGLWSYPKCGATLFAKIK